MATHTSSQRYRMPRKAAILFAFLVAGTVGSTAMHAQTCNVSPDGNGGPQYNQPMGFTQGMYNQLIPVAWPQDYTVDYVEYVGIYNTYVTSFPNDYLMAIIFAYTGFGDADNNSGLNFQFYGTNLNGLPSIGSNGNPNFQPWHQWIIVHQSDLPPNIGADTSVAWQNYGTNASPFWALGSANSRVSNTYSLNGDDVTYSASIFAHEVRHTVALEDCYYCQSGTNGTIMTASQPFLAHANFNLTGPQYCDNQQTRQTAYPY